MGLTDEAEPESEVLDAAAELAADSELAAEDEPDPPHAASDRHAATMQAIAMLARSASRCPLPVFITPPLRPPVAGVI